MCTTQQQRQQKITFLSDNRTLVLVLCIFFSFVTLSSCDYTESDNSNGNFHLKKTVYNNTRVLIVAGLEGTGHHAISAMLGICRRKRPQFCEADKELSDKLMLWERSRLAVHGLFGSSDTSESLKISADVRSYLQNLGNNRSGNHLIYVGNDVSSENGMFSYPSFTGRFKSLDHPDIYQLAILAEQANIDLRILVLQRNAVSILKSVERRHFGTKEGEEPKILIDNAAALHAQLALLDRRFFFCLDYELLAEIKSTALQRELAHFLHEDEMPKILTDMIKAIRPSSSKPLFPNFILNDSVAIKHNNANKHNSSQEYLAFQLQARLALIDQLCHHHAGRSPSKEQHNRSSVQPGKEKEGREVEEEQAPHTKEHAEDEGDSQKKEEKEGEGGSAKRRASTSYS
eukprot:gene28578-37542_t